MAEQVPVGSSMFYNVRPQNEIVKIIDNKSQIPPPAPRLDGFENIYQPAEDTN